MLKGDSFYSVPAVLGLSEGHFDGVQQASGLRVWPQRLPKQLPTPRRGWARVRPSGAPAGGPKRRLPLGQPPAQRASGGPLDGLLTALAQLQAAHWWRCCRLLRRSVMGQLSLTGPQSPTSSGGTLVQLFQLQVLAGSLPKRDSPRILPPQPTQPPEPPPLPLPAPRMWPESFRPHPPRAPISGAPLWQGLLRSGLAWRSQSERQRQPRQRRPRPHQESLRRPPWRQGCGHRR